MISNMLGLEYTGIYSTVFFFGIFVSIPAKSVKRIAIVVLSDAWKENNLSVIKEVYSKSCLNQFLLAVYLFLGIWVNIDFVFEIIPPEYAAGKYVILFIGIGQLFDMLTGVNTEIISTSKYFRYNTFFITFLITLVIILNYIFIPIYGINGAAAASALAVILINIMRYAFLYIKLDHQPFDIRIGKIVALGLICFGAISMVPIFDNVFINILLRGTMLTLLYWIPALYFRISEDIYSTFVKVIQSILGSKNND
jgi:O-antigen/teichoic acid export membrane protein